VKVPEKAMHNVAVGKPRNAFHQEKCKEKKTYEEEYDHLSSFELRGLATC
jgi:hypothetical protein